MYHNYPSYPYTPDSMSPEESPSQYSGTPRLISTPVEPETGALTQKHAWTSSSDTSFPPPTASNPSTSGFSTHANYSTGYTNNDTDVISISTSFHPGTNPPPDTIFASSDNVFFYATHQIILSATPGAFQPCLAAPLSDSSYRGTVITLDAPSAELNIILHALYKTSPAANSPSFETLVRAIDRMPRYGLSVEHLITPSTPLYELVLAHAPLYPLDSYALAAHHRIAALASTVSAYLLSHDLTMVSDEMAEKIGPVYLKRLLLLHSARFSALKEILLRAPVPHAETKECGFEEQKKLTRAWALVSAYLVWDARPDISTHMLSNALNPLLEHLTCKLCEKALKDKIKDVMVRWTSVKSFWPLYNCMPNKIDNNTHHLAYDMTLLPSCRVLGLEGFEIQVTIVW